MKKISAQIGAYHLGQAAERYGKPITACPYKTPKGKSFLWGFIKAWKQGWQDSRKARG